MLKHEQIQITLSPFQLEYISKMEAHGYSREEVIHRALNELMAKDDKVSGCHLPIGEYSQQKNNNMILVEGGSKLPSLPFRPCFPASGCPVIRLPRQSSKRSWASLPAMTSVWVPAIQHITLTGSTPSNIATAEA